MALGKNRSRMFVRGPGGLYIREKSPSAATSFTNVGYLKQTEIQQEDTVEDFTAENGVVVNSITRESKIGGTTQLMQRGIDELNLLKDASPKIYAMRYYGLILPESAVFQYIVWDNVRIKGGFENALASGQNPIPMAWRALKDLSVAYDLPEMMFAEADGELHLDSCQLWVDARFGYGAATQYIMDLSGFQRVGTISSDFANIWQTGSNPARFLRYDGAVDDTDFGNILSLDSDDDFMIEFWARCYGSDGASEMIASKKGGTAAANAGWYLVREGSDNIPDFFISDGTDQIEVSAPGTMLQNDWKHFAITGDRDGNCVMRMNNSAGLAVSMSSVDDTTASDVMRLARMASTYGDVDIGAFRFHNYGAGGLPSNIATIIGDHYNAEKAYYGL